VVARLREKTKTAVIREPPALRNVCGETPMMAERLDRRALEHHDRQPADSRLRNRLIIGNAIAWIVIIILIGLIFF
jgi:hypothetical protein